jgi:endonuclease III
MSDDDRDGQLGAILETMHREGDGVAQMALYRISDLDELIEQVELGNKQARTLHRIAHALQRHEAAHGGPDPIRCVLCNGLFEKAMAVVLIAADTELPTQAITWLICPRCDGTDQAVLARVLAVWCETISPSTRVLDIHPTAGRA